MATGDDDRGLLASVQRKPHWVDGESWLTLDSAQRAVDAVPFGDALRLADAFVSGAATGVNATFGLAILVKRAAHLDPEKDKLHGWRIVEVMGRESDAAVVAVHAGFLRDEANYLDDPSAQRMSRLAGEPRVHRMHDIVEGDPEPQREIMAYLEAVGVGDRLVAGVGLDRTTDLMLLLDRPVGVAPFDDRELSWLVAFLSTSGRAARAIARGLGHLDANAGLSPRERETLRYLLSPSSEKEIAEKLEVSVQTVHVYVKSIYRKFSVSNRAGLLDLWLR